MDKDKQLQLYIKSQLTEDASPYEIKRKSFKSNDLNIRFCPDKEILLKKQKMLMFKTQFAAKLKQLKLNGKRLQSV